MSTYISSSIQSITFPTPYTSTTISVPGTVQDGDVVTAGVVDPLNDPVTPFKATSSTTGWTLVDLAAQVWRAEISNGSPTSITLTFNNASASTAPFLTWIAVYRNSGTPYAAVEDSTFKRFSPQTVQLDQSFSPFQPDPYTVYPNTQPMIATCRVALIPTSTLYVADTSTIYGFTPRNSGVFVYSSALPPKVNKTYYTLGEAQAATFFNTNYPTPNNMSWSTAAPIADRSSGVTITLTRVLQGADSAPGDGAFWGVDL